MNATIRNACGVLGLVAICAVVGACASDGSSGSAGAADLAGKVFVATEVNGWQLVEGSALRISFGDDGIVSAEAGCNTIFGGATWDDGTLTFEGQPARSNMACNDGLMEQDDWLSGFLTGRPSVDLDDRTLTLDDGEVTVTLEQE